MTEFPELTEAKVVRVQPGDVIWLTTSVRVTPERAAHIRDRAKKLWPDNEVVVGADVDIAVVAT